MRPRYDNSLDLLKNNAIVNKKDKEMVKVINIDTKTRTIRVENAADGDIKTWRTTESGAHFPIKKGESTKEALDKFVASKRKGSDDKELETMVKAVEKTYGKDSPEAQRARGKLQPNKESGESEYEEAKARYSEAVKQRKKVIEEIYQYTKKTGEENIHLEAQKKRLEKIMVHEANVMTKIEKEEAKARESDLAEKARKRKEQATKKLAKVEPIATTAEIQKVIGKEQPKKEFDKELWDKAYEAAKKRVKGVKNPYPTHDEVQSMYEYMQSDDYKKSTEKASFKTAMQTTMKAFPRLYDFEKPHLEEFANKVYDDIQNNPGKEKEVLEHLADAYKQHIAGLGPWVDTPTLAKKAFLDQMLESHLNKQSEDK